MDDVSGQPLTAGGVIDFRRGGAWRVWSRRPARASPFLCLKRGITAEVSAQGCVQGGVMQPGGGWAGASSDAVEIRLAPMQTG